MQHQNGRQAFNPLQRYGILHGNERNDGFSVDAQLMKSFEVGLNACAA